MEESKYKEIEDEKLVQDAFQHLVDTYLASRHRKKVEIITKAFNFAKQAHKGVRRLSGQFGIVCRQETSYRREQQDKERVSQCHDHGNLHFSRLHLLP